MDEADQGESDPLDIGIFNDSYIDEHKNQFSSVFESTDDLIEEQY